MLFSTKRKWTYEGQPQEYLALWFGTIIFIFTTSGSRNDETCMCCWVLRLLAAITYISFRRNQRESVHSTLFVSSIIVMFHTFAKRCQLKGDSGSNTANPMGLHSADCSQISASTSKLLFEAILHFLVQPAL